MNDQNPMLPPPYPPSAWTPPSPPPLPDPFTPVTAPPLTPPASGPAVTPPTSPFPTSSFAQPPLAPTAAEAASAAPGSAAHSPPAASHVWRQVLISALVATIVAMTIVAGANMWAVTPETAPTAVPTLAAVDPAVTNRVQGVLAKVSPSVVTIHVEGPEGLGTGTGVIYDAEGHIVTNAHVVAGASAVEVDLASGETVTATVLGELPEADVAVLALDVVPPGLVPADIGESGALKAGQDVVAIGNALNLGDQPSVTLGIVSATQRSLLSPDGATLSGLIQTDAAINPGNSGGPLVDINGRVVGINTAIIDGAQSVGFALGSDSVVPIVDAIIAGNEPVAPSTVLGVRVSPPSVTDPALLEEFQVTDSGGVFVETVEPGSAAAAAGLQVGDVIVTLDGRSLRSPADLTRLVRSRAPGDEVTFEVVRRGKAVTITATLGAGD